MIARFTIIFSIIFCLLSSGKLLAQNQIIHNIPFSTSGQDMWQNNSTFNIDMSHELYNISIDSTYSGFNIVNIDGNMYYFATALGMKLFLNSAFHMNGFSDGTVDVDYPITVTLELPDNNTFNPGETIDITSSYIVTGGEITSHFPTDGNISLDLKYGVGLSQSLGVYLAGGGENIQVIPPTNIPLVPSGDAPIPHDSVLVFSINSDGSDAFPCDIGGGTSAYCDPANLPLNLNNALGMGIDGDINFPIINLTTNLNNTTLEAEATDDWLNINMDILPFLSFMSSSLPAPNGPALNQNIALLEGAEVAHTSNSFGFDFTTSHTSFDMGLNLINSLKQEFEFAPDIMATIKFETELEYIEKRPNGATVNQGSSDSVTFKIGNTLSITYPCSGWESIDIISVTYNIVPTFSNFTRSNMASEYSIEAMNFQINVENDATDYCHPNADCTSLLSDTDESLSSSLILFNNNWELPGFQENVTNGGGTLIPNPAFAINVVSSDVTCAGDTTGIITTTAINSAGPYTWTYTPGTTNTPDGNVDEITVHAGQYTVVVTDAFGCQLSNEVKIKNANPALNLNFTDINNVRCHDDTTGSVNSNVTGGVPPYSYFWNLPNTPTTPNINNLVTGVYTLSVFDALNCEIVDSIFIDQPGEPLAQFSITTSPPCFGASEGAIDINISGGTYPYQYIWNNGQTSQDLVDIPAGTYFGTVTDENNCSLEYSFDISEPNPFNIQIYTEDVICYGINSGIIDLTIDGGTPPYTYNWSNGNTTQDISNLFPGAYSVTITDARGCVADTITEINQTSLPLHSTIDEEQIRCFGEANGQIDLSVFGGTPPYFYEWNNNEISEDINNLIPGVYIVSITDANGCFIIDSTEIYQSAQPLLGVITTSNVTCNGGEDGNIYLDVMGGTPPNTFQWSNNSWSEDLIGVTAGIYSVTITDANDCQFHTTTEITEPTPLIIQSMDNPTICHGQTTEIGIGTISGSIEPYSIVWNNGDNGMTTLVAPLQTTTYFATVSDAIGCTTEVTNVTVYVHQPLEMAVAASEEIVCPGALVEFDVQIEGGGVVGNQVFVNDSLYNLPVVLEIAKTTNFNFEVFDSCNFKSVRVTKRIETYPLPSVNIALGATSGCSPLRVQFHETSPHVGQKYTWNFDDGDFNNLSFDKHPVHIFYNARTYDVNLNILSMDGCSVDSIIPIIVHPKPDAEFKTNTNSVTMANPTILFTNYSHGGFFYDWNFGDGNISDDENPSHTFTMPGEFYVSLKTTSLHGCIDSVGTNVAVTNELAFYAPTAFTPNNDELNEEFIIFIDGMTPDTFIMKIYDRWGEIIYSTNNIDEGWNGRHKDRICDSGVYIWEVEFVDRYGNKYSKHGNVTLLR